jgi:hypothetical protein
MNACTDPAGAEVTTSAADGNTGGADCLTRLITEAGTSAAAETTGATAAEGNGKGVCVWSAVATRPTARFRAAGIVSAAAGAGAASFNSADAESSTGDAERPVLRAPRWDVLTAGDESDREVLLLLLFPARPAEESALPPSAAATACGPTTENPTTKAAAPTRTPHRNISSPPSTTNAFVEIPSTRGIPIGA